MTPEPQIDRQTHVRYLIIAILFVVSCFSFADRSVLSQAVSVMPKEMDLTAQRMSYLLFAFGWAYALGQLPSGGLLDRFGSKRVYGIAIIGWSVCAFLTAFAGYFAASAAFTAIFILRVLSGLFQSPVFPGNGRIVASWFPTSERGRASAIFNSAQYFALPIFAPIFGWLIHVSGWRSLLLVPGRAGLRARRGLVHEHLRRQRTSAAFRSRRLKPSSAAAAWSIPTPPQA